MKRNKNTVFDYVNCIILLAVAILCVYPFYYIFITSISDGVRLQNEVISTVPLTPNWEAYKHIFTNPKLDITLGMRNSILYTVSGTVVAVCVTFMTAYVLSRRRFVGKYVILGIYTFTWVFNAGTIPAYIFMNSLHLINNPLVMIIPGAINVQFLVITKSFIDSLPYDLEEAALIDGANQFTIMTKIYLPVCKPIIATITVFYAVFMWNQYLAPKIYLQDASMHTIQLVLQRLVIDQGGANTSFSTFIQNGILLNPQNLKAAAVFIAMVPILLVYPFVQKYFQKGIMLGSVKG